MTWQLLEELSGDRREQAVARAGGSSPEPARRHREVVAHVFDTSLAASAVDSARRAAPVTRFERCRDAPSVRRARSGAPAPWPGDPRLYATILTVGYMVSRGLAKSGSRDPYWDDGDSNGSRNH